MHESLTQRDRLAKGIGRLVPVTQLFSLRENAIVKEPESSYSKPWRCVS